MEKKNSEKALAENAPQGAKTVADPVSVESPSPVAEVKTAKKSASSSTATAASADAPAAKKAHKVRSNSDVKKLAKHLAEVLPEGSTVTVPLAMEDYNDFVDKFQKPEQKEEGRGFRANAPVTSDYVQSFTEKGITINIQGKV